MPTAPLKFTIYKFTKPYKQPYCKTMGGTGISGCVEYASRFFKVGDTVVSAGGNAIVSDGTNPPFVNGKLYGDDTNGEIGNIPLSVLNKVAADIDNSQLQAYTTNSNKPDAKSFFTTKNIIIGLLAISAIIGGLKVAKVF